MNQVVPIHQSAVANYTGIMESVLIKGDLSKLTADERSTYYMRVCESVGLNPLTKPFEYLALNGKLVLYALRACTDQLRGIHNVSVLDLTEAERDGVFIVTAKVRNGEGRTDMAKGAVTIGGLKGDALANAIMKAETKAKRRATLSLCGLGFLDETELETIPSLAQDAPRTTVGTTSPIAKEIFSKLQAEIRAQTVLDELYQWGANNENKARKAMLPPNWQTQLSAIYGEQVADLKKPKPAIPSIKNDTPRFAKWLHGRLTEFKDPHQLVTYTNDTIMPMIDDADLFPTDRDELVGIINSHEERLAP